VVSNRFGVWDRWYGLHHLEKVAANFETSYAHNVTRRVLPGDPAWKPLLRLINKYSTADLPKDREPKALVRSKAVLSNAIEAKNEVVAEWTAPTTPIILLYKESLSIEPQDYRHVGSIGDLRTWVTRSKDDFRFLVQDVSLALFSLVFASTLWVVERPQ
jgi:hypothetical protein